MKREDLIQVMSKLPKNYRRCISCRQVFAKTELIRVVKDYRSNKILINEGMGRSTYFCPQQECYQKAKHKNKLGKSLKAFIPDSLYQILGSLITSCN